MAKKQIVSNASAAVIEAPASEAPAAVIEAPASEAPASEAPASKATPAAAPRQKKAITPSGMVGNIKAACIALNSHPVIGKMLEYREFNASGSFVVRLPRFADAVDVLDVSPDSKIALTLLRSTRAAVESLTGTSKQTWVFHTAGSFALYSKMNG
jgi:hypothetical protein